jgi:cell wall-associated NlpC family hydrolase
MLTVARNTDCGSIFAYYEPKSTTMRSLMFTLLFAFLFGSFCFGLRHHSTPVVTAVAGMNYEAVTMPVITNTVAQPNSEASSENNAAAPIEVSAGSIDPGSFVEFAKSFIGTPYVYGSTDPNVGFDCSGFINHVSGHFGLKVPRSSVDFTNVGIEVSRNEARAGDFILFTGTDSTRRVVGHMGIVTRNEDGGLEFVHSSSGKAKGVVLSELEGYYETRFVKVIRLLA